MYSYESTNVGLYVLGNIPMLQPSKYLLPGYVYGLFVTDENLRIYAAAT